MSEFDDTTAEHAQTAAQLSPDVAVEHIADVYARALLGAAGSAGAARAVLDEFDALVADVLDRFPKLEAVLASGFVSEEEKSGIIDRVFGGADDPPAGHPVLRPDAGPRSRGTVDGRTRRRRAEPTHRRKTPHRPGSRTGGQADGRSQPDRRPGRPRRRYRLRRLDRQPIAKYAPTDNRQERA